MAKRRLCLTDAQISTVVDALYFLKGLYAVQALVDVIDTDQIDDQTLFDILVEIEQQVPCGDNPVSCDDIRNCVEQNAAQIFQTINNDIDIVETVINNITEQNTNIFNVIVQAPSFNGIPCEDRMFGAIRQLLNKLHADALELFARLEVLTNFGEFINDLAQAIPRAGAGVLASLATIATLDEVFEFFQEQYISQVTEDYLEGIACEIFCRLQNRCTISLRDIYDAIDAELPDTIIPPFFSNSLQSWLDYFLALDTDEIVGSVPLLLWLFQLQALRSANWILADRPFLNVAARPVTERYLRVLRAGFLDGDSGHRGLCECREQFTSVFLSMQGNAGTPSATIEGYPFNPRSRLWESPTWDDALGQTVWRMRFDNVSPTQMGLFMCGIGSSTDNQSPRIPIYLRSLIFSHETAAGNVNNVGLQIQYRESENGPIITKTGVGSVTLPRGQYWSIWLGRNPANATENNNTYMRVAFRAGVNLVPEGVRYTNVGSAVVRNWVRTF